MLSLAQVLTSGLGLAGYYALVAVGFALIFATLRIFHIAHGTVFIVGGYAFYALHRLAGVNEYIAAIAAMAVAGLLGLAIDKVVYAPVLKRGGGMFSVFIASLGVALIFESGFLVWSKGVVSVARTGLLDILIVGDVVFRYLDFFILGVVAAAYVALWLWFHRTATGLEVRGLTDNADLAAIVGVDVSRTRNAIFLVASSLAGLAGVLTAWDTGILPSSGFQTIFIGVVAMILGGTRNLLLGTAVGALCLGLLTAFAGFFFPEWISFSVFLIMIVLIVVRPQGILG